MPKMRRRPETVLLPLEYLGGAVCRNWRRSGHRLHGLGRAQLGRGPGITGTAHDRTSRRQPPDRPEHSSPRKNRAARCPHRRPRQSKCAQWPWPPRLALPWARSMRGTGPCGGVETPLATSGRLALPYGRCDASEAAGRSLLLHVVQSSLYSRCQQWVTHPVTLHVTVHVDSGWGCAQLLVAGRRLASLRARSKSQTGLSC